MLVFGAVLYALGIAGITHLAPPDVKQALLLAFILSFSSTVFAVKILEDRAEMASFHGRVAIGILIMQDLLAVIFLAASRGQLPSPWALLVVGSSLMVFSGYRLCKYAREQGKSFAILNIGHTRADADCRLKVELPCHIVLPEITNRLLNRY